jgi:pyridoxamine 5'-phosphate oxidase
LLKTTQSIRDPFINKNKYKHQMNDLSDYRKSYDKNELIETEIPQNPIELFQNWFAQMEDLKKDQEVNAMTISTFGLDGFPRGRVVLLKKFDLQGFVFYTNYDSDKGKAIVENPNVCLSFFWESMERQVIIKGVAEKLAKNISDDYFDSRPEGSKLGAVVSNQSEVIASRAILEEKLEYLEKEFQNKPIARPENWGGFLVRPIEIEFWQGRPNRLHDRIRYQLQTNLSYKIERLSP